MGFSLHGPPTGSQLPLSHPLALVWVFSMGYGWISASCGSPWAAGQQQLHHGPHHNCRGIWALAPGASPLPPSALTFRVCRAVPLACSHHTLLWSQLKLCRNLSFDFFLSILSQKHYHHPSVGQQHVHSWSHQDSARCCGSFWSFSQKPPL